MARFYHFILAAVAAVSAPVWAAEKPPKVSYDPYQRMTAIVGQIHTHNALLDLDKWDWWLSGAITNGIPKNPVLMFSTDTPDWYFFESAADVDGQQLPVIQAGKDVEYGSVHELVAVELTPKYLADHRSTGVNLKLMGSRGSRVIIIPPEALAAFEASYLAEVQKAGGFREDLAATEATLAPSPEQKAQAAQAMAAQGAARGGLGISFVVAPQGMFLMAVAPNSRAERGHLKPGQLITAVNGKSIAGLSQAEDVALIKGAPGRITFSVAGIGDVGVDP